jgi:flagellin-like hook-associated protein FlgL
VVGPTVDLDAADKLLAGKTYEITTAPHSTLVADIVANSDLTDNAQAIVGSTFTVHTEYTLADAETVSVREIDASVLTRQIEIVQGKINGARVQAGSQYAALESAVQYTTDLTAQYELGYNTVNDVNFSMETAHLAKNQILQQAATAMLAQANEGQQGLLQLIQR